MKLTEVSVKNLTNLIVGYQYDHKKQAFKFIDVPHPELNQYLKIVVDWQKQPLLFPLKDNEYVVGQPFTLHCGFFKAQLMVKDTDGNYIANTRVFNLEIMPSIDPGEKYENVDPNLEIVYDEMKDLIDAVNGKLENGDFDGLSAYEVAVENGFKGSELEWLESLKGQKGARGERGERGEKGETGATGQPGKDGTNGIDGVSPIVQVTEIENGHKVSITDKEGLTQFDVMNGLKGDKGDKGEPYEHSDEFTQLAEQVKLDAKSSKESEQKALEYSNAIKASSDQIAQNKADIEDLRNNPSVDLDLIEKLSIKDTATGNPCVITDSADWRLQNMKIYGESTQVTTTGAQLFNKETRVVGKIIDGNTGNELSNGRYACSDFIEIPQGTTNLYQMNGAINQRAFYDENKTFISKPNNNNNNNTQVVENAKYIRITSDIDKTDMSNIMLNVGTTAKPYEQYTGGKPSPSVEYPQQIVSKEISQIKIDGANLFNSKLHGFEVGLLNDNGVLQPSFTMYFASGYIPIYPNTQYMSEMLGGNGYKVLGAFFFDENKVIISNNNNKPFTTPTNAKYVRISVNKTGGLVDELNNHFMLVCGSKMTNSYVPYQEPQSVSLQPPKPLTKWDRLEKRDGVWNWVYKSKTKEVNSESRVGLTSRIFDNYSIYMVLNFFDKNATPFMCEKFLCEKIDYYWNFVDKTKLMSVKTETNLFVCLDKSIADAKDQTSLEEWNAFIKEHFFTVLYESANEELIPLSEQEQQALNELTMYYPNTVIHTGAQTEVTYIADPKLYIDKKLQPLNTVQSQLLKLESEI